MQNHKQIGISMIEVLIAILVISFGILAITMIINNSLKSGHGAATRTQATWLAQEIIDRMRANRTVAEANPSPYAISSCANTVTSPSTIAAADLRSWCTAVTKLPSGTANITYDLANNKFTVEIQWNEASRRASTTQVANSGRLIVSTRL